MRGIYSFLLALLAPWLERRLRRVRAGGPRLFSPADFSRLEKQWQNAEKRPIWLHCASAGEVVAAQPLIERLQAQQTPFYITVFSPNGAMKLTELFGEGVPWDWLPLDTAANMRRLVQRLRPRQLWLLEGELWPNLIATAHEAGVPITLINGRVGHKSRNAPALLRRLWRETLPLLDRYLARSETDAQWFRALGVPSDRIETPGNLKWLSAAYLAGKPPRVLRNAPYHLFASAYVEEMEAFFPAMAERTDLYPWVVVPRRPQDAKTMDRQARDAGLTVHLINSDEEAGHAEADCLIETRFGNLPQWVAGAHSVIMGGSFAPFGGHNFLEDLALGKPVLTGTDMRDFEEETAFFLRHQALVQSETPECALDVLAGWVRHAEEGEAVGRRGQALLRDKAEQVAARYFSLLNL